jgi:hypothetical protein
MPFRVKNWDEFQHYKKRRPPWIKLHRSILDDYAFCSLPDASRALAPCIWLVASESDDGTIPDDPAELAFRLRQSVEWIKSAVKPLIDGGFLECLDGASMMLADCYQNHLSETEERQSTEERRERGASRQMFVKPTPHDVDLYILERGYRGFSGEEFVAFYQSKGWVIGKQPMKDWKAAVTTWAKRHGKDTKRADGLTGNTSDPNRPCAYCGGPYPCKCYEEA